MSSDPQEKQSTSDVVVDFAKAYQENSFSSPESRSGPGSTLLQTAHIRAVLPDLFSKLEIKSILDAPCGDFNWMRELDLSGISYTGVDMVPEVIKANQEQFGSRGFTFLESNITTSELPRADLIICRDCLVHMSFDDGLKAIQNFKRSGAKYLLTTTFTDRDINEHKLTYLDLWRPLNLTKAPFSFPPPQELINEKCTEGMDMMFADKCLGLWELAKI